MAPTQTLQEHQKPSRIPGLDAIIGVSIAVAALLVLAFIAFVVPRIIRRRQDARERERRAAVESFGQLERTKISEKLRLGQPSPRPDKHIAGELDGSVQESKGETSVGTSLRTTLGTSIDTRDELGDEISDEIGDDIGEKIGDGDLERGRSRVPKALTAAQASSLT
ncbi:hypothetical protein TWF481_001428 [Arthrobotrys musiformis]|uniref:Uncharacterized protein n=1 Tax=Arthrobotrys musiformis TaxID=47236 RepID=A0AAV9WQS4_9PEZI